MKKIEITDFGASEAVARCVEAPDVGAPGAGEIVIDVLAFPINPADLLFCRGRYQSAPSLPATPGAECVGRVAAIGSGVTDLRPGDLVTHLQREKWVQRARPARFASARAMTSARDVRLSAVPWWPPRGQNLSPRSQERASIIRPQRGGALKVQ